MSRSVRRLGEEPVPGPSLRAASTARMRRMPQAILSRACGTKNSSGAPASSTERPVSTIILAHVSAGTPSIDIRLSRTGGDQSRGAQAGRVRRMQRSSPRPWWRRSDSTTCHSLPFSPQMNPPHGGTRYRVRRVRSEASCRARRPCSPSHRMRPIRSSREPPAGISARRPPSVQHRGPEAPDLGLRAQLPCAVVPPGGAEVPAGLAGTPFRSLGTGLVDAQRMQPRHDAGEGLARARRPRDAAAPAARVAVDLDARIGIHGPRDPQVDGPLLLRAQD